MAGLAPSQSIRLGGPQPADLSDPLDVELDDDISIDPSKNALEIKLPNGDILVNLGGIVKDDKDSKFGDNLAELLDDSVLGQIADELIRGVESDDESRSEWLSTRTDAIEMLGFKIEKPSSGTSNEPAGISRVRHPVLAEAVIRGQATARSELLPSDGPCKVRNDDPQSTMIQDELANALEKDMNHYLTTTASEYYPDTDRMLFWIYLGGCGFKKVYHDPIRNRPVSESIDAENVIVSNAAIDIKSAPRVTHRFFMRPSTLKRMQILEAYRDCDLEDPAMADKSSVDEAKEGVAGVRSNTSDYPEDREYEMFEVYCELDIPGFEHKHKGKIDGLPVPYKVTIEKNSRQILEIRRNWDEEDPLCLPKYCIVKFPFLPSFGFYDVGLAQIMGNLANAATAGLREGLDAGMFANFPGFLIGKNGTRQNTMDIRVAPGQGAPVDMGGANDIRQAIMPLPYKEMGPGMMSLLQNVVETAMRIGGAADIQVGEGRQDAPVGTTVALIEAANRPMDAVHKRLVHAQGEELKMLVERFREDPEAFYRDRKLPSKKQWNEDQFKQAIADYDLIPAADPNTSSSVQRIAKAQALYQLAKDNPAAFDQRAIYHLVIKGLGFSMPDQLLNNQPPQQGVDPKSQADLLTAQAKMQEAQNKAQAVQVDHLNAVVDGQNRAQDREAREKIAQLNFQRDLLLHGSKQELEKQKLAATQQQAVVGLLHQRQTQADKLASDHLLQQRRDEQAMLRQHHQAQENRAHKVIDILNQPNPNPEGPIE